MKQVMLACGCFQQEYIVVEKALIYSVHSRYEII